MSQWVKSAAAILLALAGAVVDHFVFDNSSVNVTQATIQNSGEIAGCDRPSDAWLAHIEALVEEVRAEVAGAEAEIAEGE